MFHKVTRMLDIDVDTGLGIDLVDECLQNIDRHVSLPAVQRGLGSITAQVLLLGARDCWREWNRLGTPAPEDCATIWERMHE